MKNSSKIAESDLREFLERLANVRATFQPGSGIDYGQAEALLAEDVDFFPPSFDERNALSVLVDEDHAELAKIALVAERTADDRRRDALHHVFQLSEELKRIWDQPDPRTKDYLNFELRRKYRVVMAIDGAEVPAFTMFDQAMEYLQQAGSRAKHCANPACANPYFIAAKRSYKYCNPDCAQDSQRAFKRDWWAEHGPGWRKRRESKLAVSSPKGGKHGKR
jgi:hypothetical protein